MRKLILLALVLATLTGCTKSNTKVQKYGADLTKEISQFKENEGYAITGEASGSATKEARVYEVELDLAKIQCGYTEKKDGTMEISGSKILKISQQKFRQLAPKIQGQIDRVWFSCLTSVEESLKKQLVMKILTGNNRELASGTSINGKRVLVLVNGDGKAGTEYNWIVSGL